jgi:hypothetical protein
MRFHEVPPPFDERVAASLFARIRDIVLIALRVRARVEAGSEHLATLANNQTFVDKMTASVVDALRPGSVAFLCFAFASMVWVMHAVVLRLETKRVLASHGKLD